MWKTVPETVPQRRIFARKRQILASEHQPEILSAGWPPMSARMG
jgi:hypothetical protein